MTQTQLPLFLTMPMRADADVPDDVPDPVDPIPDSPDETPVETPVEAPDTPAPDLPEEAPTEVPDDLPGREPGTYPQTPEELPEAPTPVLPVVPEEAPAPWHPEPEDMPPEIPENPGFDGTLSLRPGRPLDAGKLGQIITDAVTAATWKPRLHSGVEDIAHAGRMIDRGWITVAMLDERVAGFLAREGDYIHCLYIADFAQGHGVGAALLEAAKEGRDRLELWTFQYNKGAQRFYRREGFRPMEETEGLHNDEGLPDVRFLWEREKRESASP